MNEADKPAIANDPCRRSLAAEELDDRQIEKIFRAEPTSLVIITPTRQIWRDEWKANRLREAYGGK